MGRDSGNAVAPRLSLMDVFAKALPTYLLYGMTCEQFWDGDVSAHKAYREAHRLKIRETNQLMWLQGAYFYEALMDAAPAIKAFCKSKARPYVKEPYDLDEEDKRRREEREQQIRYERIKEKVAQFAKANNGKRNSIQSPDGKGEEVINA